MIFCYGFIIASLLWTILFFFHKTMKRKKTELSFTHESFVHIVENTNDFIYYAQVYPEVKFKYLSPSAENFFGKGSIAGALVSADVAFMDIHPDDYHILIKKIKGELDYSSGIIQRWKDSEGRYRWFEEYATPIFENGKLAALQGVCEILMIKWNYRRNLNIE